MVLTTRSCTARTGRRGRTLARRKEVRRVETYQAIQIEDTVADIDYNIALPSQRERAATDPWHDGGEEATNEQSQLDKVESDQRVPEVTRCLGRGRLMADSVSAGAARSRESRTHSICAIGGEIAHLVR